MNRTKKEEEVGEEHKKQHRLSLLRFKNNSHLPILTKKKYHPSFTNSSIVYVKSNDNHLNDSNTMNSTFLIYIIIFILANSVPCYSTTNARGGLRLL